MLAWLADKGIIFVAREQLESGRAYVRSRPDGESSSMSDSGAEWFWVWQLVAHEEINTAEYGRRGAESQDVPVSVGRNWCCAEGIPCRS